ncbi:transposase family protein [Streptomyces europaeiscabiei]|uniref:transposase family protein n=1 Tax=Streptomyces europaeiscabiei TaxID=146819 RepID=UPI002E144A11|nr:transposase family protein [Streptomyces europaeiscabiei]
MESMSLASERTLLLRRLAEVRDPRDPRGRCFSLVSLLLVTLCATAAEFGSYRAMAQWAAAAGPVELLRLGLRPLGPFQLVRTPSADTLRRALTLVRPADLEVLLRVRGLGLETVAVDGKVLRGSGSSESVAVTVIGAMAQNGALVAQQRVADKSNEIPALAPLLSVLDLHGVVVTADALCRRRHNASYEDLWVMPICCPVAALAAASPDSRSA